MCVCSECLVWHAQCPSVCKHIMIWGGKVELPLPTQYGPRRAINYGTQDNNHFLQAPCSKYCCPKGPRGWEVWLWPEVQEAHWGQGERPLLSPWMLLVPSIPFWSGQLGLSVIKLDETFCINAVSTHLLGIKTINPLCIRIIGEGQLHSLIILNIRKFFKKCSFSRYGKQCDSFSHR